MADREREGGATQRWARKAFTISVMAWLTVVCHWARTGRLPDIRDDSFMVPTAFQPCACGNGMHAIIHRSSFLQAVAHVNLPIRVVMNTMCPRSHPCDCFIPHMYWCHVMKRLIFTWIPTLFDLQIHDSTRSVLHALAMHRYWKLEYVRGYQRLNSLGAE